MSNFDLVMESDMGTFNPVALQFTGSDAARKVGLKTQQYHTIKYLFRHKSLNSAKHRIYKVV